MHRLLVLATLTLSACQPPGSSPPPELTAAVSANAQALFAHYDQNHDSQLTPAEAAHLSLAGSTFDALDANHDSRLSWPEFGAPARLAALTHRFTLIATDLVSMEDEDGDGKLSSAEYRLGMLIPYPGPMVASPLADPVAASFERGDANHDGFMTTVEAPALVSFLLEQGYHLQQRSH